MSSEPTLTGSDPSGGDTNGRDTNRGDTNGGDPPIIGSLSPSRAGDFLTCPLLYRLRTIDRIPQQPSLAATKGTLVHSVLERLFDQPAAQRTLSHALALLGPQWDALLADQSELAALFADDAALATWLGSAQRLLEAYFTLEDPGRFEPTERESFIQVVLPGGLRLRGIVDRLDVAPTGEIRVVDYKSGRSPRPAYEGKALFQMTFYALVIWRTRGVVPALLQLLYLGDSKVVRYLPTEADLLALEQRVLELWAQIEAATARRDFPATPNKLCGWCDHQALCPAFGGTPPPFPTELPGPLAQEARHLAAQQPTPPA